MRELLSDLEADGPIDPVERAKVLSRRTLPKRFYKEVSVGAAEEGGHRVLLDGRPVKTAGRKTLTVPQLALAEALAGEWAAQETSIDPMTMPLTRIANVAIDAVALRLGEVADDVAAYAGNDLLCYRADTPQSLVSRQETAWRPVLDWAESRFSGRFVLAEGIMPVRQDPALIGRVRDSLEGMAALRLAALHVATTLTGSGLLALALEGGLLPAEAVWAAAHVDEDWNCEQWGGDAEAEKVRALRKRDFDAAALILAETARG